MKKGISSLLMLFGATVGIAQSGSGIPDFGFRAYNEGQPFTAITVDQNNDVWVGTDKQGLFYLNQSSATDSFEELNIGDPNLATVKIEAMYSDNLGNVWVGQSGINLSTNGIGGLERIAITDQSVQHYSPDRNALGFTYFERDGIATLNVKDVTVDPNGTVWIAQGRHQLVSGATYILTPGTMSYKTIGSERFVSKSTWQHYLNNQESSELPYPAHTYNPSVTATPQSRNCSSISSDSTEVWMSVYPYLTKDTEEFLPTRILRYDLEGNFIDEFTQADIGFPQGGVFNGIFRNNKKGAWATVGSSDRGFAVFKNGEWKHMSPEVDSIRRILPLNTYFNNNAVWGNEYGNVFMGTNNGLLVYDGKGPVDHVSSYTLYSKTPVIEDFYKPLMIIDENMVSNNILGGVSEKENGDQWIITDNGIMKGVFGGFRSSIADAWILPSPSGLGFLVYKNNAWKYMSPSIDSIQKIIPPGTTFNNNAFWGNEYGNIFMGTNNGLLVYDGRGQVDYVSSYTFYSNEWQMENSPFEVVDDAILSNNILGGYSVNDSIQRIQTENGGFDYKVGFIKTDYAIGVCPPEWRKKTDYSQPNSPNQCLLSVDNSTSSVVRYVENQIANRSSEDKTYHLYQTDTKIGNPRDENGEIYTVERIFELLVKNAAFQAITPYDMPTEVLGDKFLTTVTHDHIGVFTNLVNQQTERIPTVQSIMDLDPALQEYTILHNSVMARIGFGITEPARPIINYGIGNFPVSHPESQSSIDDFFRMQIASNPKKSIHETQVYHLYNTPSAARTRLTFDALYGGTIPIINTRVGIKLLEDCEGNGLENIRYDPVIMHIDETNYTITNYTMEGHYFHPGKICRTVYRDNETGDIYIRTIGEGLHFCKGGLGEFSGKLNTIMGLILFKNVDLRFRDTIRNPLFINN